MSLNSGDKLGPYEIIEAAGAGGMGEVYKAKDSRLDRTVAIKILPSNLAGSPDLRQRFDREAKAISSLNHPHICILHDIGHQDGVDFLVMEYLEGETLSSRLEKSPMENEELLTTAIQIADALDSAHRQGLIHRDLKPANVMMTKEGAKLMDFGLAKLQMDNPTGAPVTNITQTTPLTGAGTILGTMQYMSPEQLEGKEADARSDIFAFGAMLYEMTTGKRPFEGSSQATLIAAIIEREPMSITAIKPLTPPGLERLTKKCLSKDPDSRWQTARDLGDELRWIAQSGSKAGIPVQVSIKRRFKMRVASIVAVLAVLACGYFSYMLYLKPKPEIPVVRFKFSPEQGLRNVDWPRISPNGKMIAFNADDSLGNNNIWIRPFSSLEAYPLLGTENANRHYWSPDSKYLAFFQGTQLKKIPVTGGQIQLICEGPLGSDLSWGSKDIIVFDGNLGDTMRMVSADGGLTTDATSLDTSTGDAYHAWPWFLPDGENFLFIANSTDSAGSGVTKLKLGSVSSPENRTLYELESENRIEYCNEGFILFFQDNNLMALPFDDKKLEITGEPKPIAQQISFSSNAPVFGSSDDGTLMFESGSSSARSELVWFDREGNELERVGQQDNYRDVVLSPDETMFVYGLFDQQFSTDDLWIYDLKRNVSTRLTFENTNEVWPIWSNDGKFIYYASNADGNGDIYKKDITGLGEAEIVYNTDGNNVGPNSFTPDGTQLIFTSLGNPVNVGVLNFNDSNRVDMITNSSFVEIYGQVSPNGKYLSYSSNESGQMEIYVRQLKGGGGKWQISTDGGNRSRWSKNGNELFYWQGNDLTVVPINTEGNFEAGNPELLFTRQWNRAGFVQFRYDVSNDGKRFLINSQLVAAEPDKVVIVQNWIQEHSNK
jgi:serine/threonine protein kinase